VEKWRPRKPTRSKKGVGCQWSFYPEVAALEVACVCAVAVALSGQWHVAQRAGQLARRARPQLPPMADAAAAALALVLVLWCYVLYSKALQARTKGAGMMACGHEPIAGSSKTKTKTEDRRPRVVLHLGTISRSCRL
jgi:hypothetical protein